MTSGSSDIFSKKINAAGSKKPELCHSITLAKKKNDDDHSHIKSCAKLEFNPHFTDHAKQFRNLTYNDTFFTGCGSVVVDVIIT